VKVCAACGKTPPTDKFNWPGNPGPRTVAGKLYCDDKCEHAAPAPPAPASDGAAEAVRVAHEEMRRRWGMSAPPCCSEERVCGDLCQAVQAAYSRGAASRPAPPRGLSREDFVEWLCSAAAARRRIAAWAGSADDLEELAGVVERGAVERFAKERAKGGSNG
jgi:hypothetical protein